MENAVEVENQDALTTRKSINVTWNPLSVIDNHLFEINNPKVDISLLRYKEDEEVWEETAMLATDLPNNGRASVMLPDIQPLDESRPLDLTLIQVTLNTSTSITQSPRMKRNPVSRALRSLKRFSKALILQFIEYIEKKSPREKLQDCIEWYLDDEGVDERSILPCPCRKNQVANRDDRYKLDSGSDILRENLFHPKSESCYRQKTTRR